jgi:hypothetical protein
MTLTASGRCFRRFGLSTVFPFRDAISDVFHRGRRGLAQSSIAGDLTTDPCALTPQHLSHVFQFAHDGVDFIDRGARDASHQSVKGFGGSMIGLRCLGDLRAQCRDTIGIARLFRSTPLRWSVYFWAWIERVGNSPFWSDHRHFCPPNTCCCLNSLPSASPVRKGFSTGISPKAL